MTVDVSFHWLRNQVLRYILSFTISVVALQEAYLPPALRTTREMKATGSGSDSVSPPRLSKPKTYGTTANDQVTFADEEGR